ncbi:beta-lactamase/transpeptidase-like protein [Mycena galopus ATCC 62051]|nr:beta-lactamase/transpeptidase-like protein [Mycena galopus ATCC 62051]
MQVWSAVKFSVCCLWAIAHATPTDLGQRQQPFSLSNEPPVFSERLDSAILDILEEFKTPGGVGVAVVRKTAQGTWNLESKGYGNATLQGHKVTADTLFSIGSNSKLFDVLVAGLLISNETLTPRISWSSKIASIIPEWKLMDPVATRESTIVDLMSHRTGLPRHDLLGPLDNSPADVISLLQYLRPSTGFREQTQYNNHMYTVLSHLPLTLVNTTYENYVQDNILTPLRMHNTTYFYADAVKTGHLADGFLREGANLTDSDDPFAQGTIHRLPYWDQSTKGHATSGAGGVISNAKDMAIWLQMLLMEGKSKSNQTVIPAEVIRKAATGVTVLIPVAPYPELSPVVYGGGQMRGTYRGYEMIEHGGATVGFRSQITRFPSENFGIAVMSNDDDLGSVIMESVKYRIIDEVFELEVIDWTTRYRTQVAKAVPPPPLPRAKDAEATAVPYATLAGAYTHAAYGTLDFCFFWKNVTTGSACAALVEDVAVRLHGVVEPNVPTLIARWETMVTDYVRLAHYAGNLFNLTALRSYPTEVPREFWVRKVEGMRAEFEVKGEEIGFAPIDMWGPGSDVIPPEGNTVEERAEVWFAKL